MMLLVKVLVRSLNYGRSGNRNINKASYLEEKNRASSTVFQAKGKDVETFCGENLDFKEKCQT